MDISQYIHRTLKPVIEMSWIESISYTLVILGIYIFIWAIRNIWLSKNRDYVYTWNNKKLHYDGNRLREMSPSLDSRERDKIGPHYIPPKQ